MIKKLMICPYFGTLPPWFDSYLANIEMLKPLGYDWHITTNLKLFKERVGDILGIKCPIVPGTGKLWDYRPAFGVLFAEELKRYDYWGHTDFDCVYGRVDRFVTDEFLGLATPRVESRRDPAVDPRHWLIHFEDTVTGPEVFTSESAARTRLATLQNNWTCHLFEECVGDRPDSAPLPPEAASPTQKVLDIHSNHHNYMCGPWSLYRNREYVNNLFMLHSGQHGSQGGVTASNLPVSAWNWREILEWPEPMAWIETSFTGVVDWAAQQGTLTRKYTHWQEFNPGDTSNVGNFNGSLSLYDRKRGETRNEEIMMCHFRHTKEYPKGVKFV